MKIKTKIKKISSFPYFYKIIIVFDQYEDINNWLKKYLINSKLWFHI